MADDKDLLSRADSLIRPDAAAAIAERRENPRQMRRRRSFLASATPSDAARFARRSGEDDDLPVLTEVVLAEPAEPEETVESIAASLRPGLAADLAALLDRHLAAELPALLETASRNASEHLRQALQTTIASALRDFVGERGQLELPLESADASEAVAADQDPD
ncbi:hypothetical protein [Candidatus Accumulibacter sp. ACC003]|uniref:hypothetical protein n=1 Tax=Candidatus Accumulibacter sp. ACC003 TaxID=2823334 RepID=UPI0025C2879C|nr:hypothetical protein [Candidatus Accumulibacter sp. ACC003]